jgi:hypothetical protein
LLLASCAGTPAPAEAEPVDYHDLPFNPQYAQYLGKSREEGLGAILADTGGEEAWDFTEEPKTKEPVTIDGDEYIMHVHADQLTTWNYYFSRTVYSDDSEEKLAEVEKVYNAAVDILGEPLEQWHDYEELANKVGNPVYNGDDQTGGPWDYRAYWDIDRHAVVDSQPDANYDLFFQIRVEWSKSSVNIYMGYYVNGPIGLSTLYLHDESILPFYGHFMKYLGRPIESLPGSVILDTGGEEAWELSEREPDSALPTPTSLSAQRIELVTIDGADYRMVAEATKDEHDSDVIWRYGFSRQILSDDSTAKSAEIDRVYNYVVDFLGEPLNPIDDSIDLSKKVGNPVYNGDDDGEMRGYSAAWLMGPNSSIPYVRGNGLSLYFTMSAIWESDSLWIVAGYSLRNAEEMSENFE